jgi:hypothetical protein
MIPNIAWWGNCCRHPGFRSKSMRRASEIKLSDGLNEFFLVGQRQGRRLSAASRLTWESQNAASPLRGEAESGRARRAGSWRRRSGGEGGERSIPGRARRNRQPNGDSENPASISFRSGGPAPRWRKVPPPDSGAGRDSGEGRVRSFTDETRDGEGRGQDIGQEGGLGAVGATEPGRAFYTVPSLVGIATFGITAAPGAQVPGGRVDLEIARQAEAAIGQGQADTDEIPQVWRGLAVRAGRGIGGWSQDLHSGRAWGDEEVGLGRVKATLTADPFAIMALIIVAVEGEPITKGAEGVTQSVIAAFETRQWVIILLVMAYINRAKRMQVVMDKAQDIIKDFPRIADDFANLE